MEEQPNTAEKQEPNNTKHADEQYAEAPQAQDAATIEKTRGKKAFFKQNVIAMVYDFDGTLSPQSMQEYTVLPELGVDSNEFWRQVSAEKKKEHADQILTYMRLLIKKIESQERHLERKDLRALASKIKYFDGVEDWFKRIGAYVDRTSDGAAKVKHYIISAGNKEILEGCSIKKHFENIFACEYHYDHHNRATFPNVVVNDTSKTQFLFRINKGKEDIVDSVNEHMPERERPVPFENILYLGDGLTDVPCMTVARRNGGHAIAVYKPHSKNGHETCQTLFSAERIDFFAPADYSENSLLDKYVKTILNLKIQKIAYAKERFEIEKSVHKAEEKRLQSKA